MTRRARRIALSPWTQVWLRVGLALLLAGTSVAGIAAEARGSRRALGPTSSLEARVDALEDCVAADDARLTVIEQRGSPTVASLETRFARLEAGMDVNRQLLLALIIAVLGQLLAQVLAALRRMEPEGDAPHRRPR